MAEITEAHVAAYLNEVRKRSRWRSSADEIAAPGATAIGSARDVPRLLAAVEAVLAEHPSEYHNCTDAYPCPTYTVISRELLGEGETR